MGDKLPTYLLKAPPDDMDRWRARASDAGVSFATFARSALNAYDPSVAGRDNGTCGPLASDNARDERAPAAAAPQRAARPATDAVRHGRPASDLATTFKPDFKSNKKR